MSCLEGGFRSIAQDSAFFHDSLGYHEWEGVSDDSAEAERLGKNVKDTSICCLIMYNHGFCALGATLGEAWVLAYYFEISCRNQLNLLQTGQPIKYPDPKVLQHSHDQLVCGGIEFRAGQAEWAALRRMVAGREGRDRVANMNTDVETNSKNSKYSKNSKRGSSSSSSSSSSNDNSSNDNNSGKNKDDMKNTNNDSDSSSINIQSMPMPTSVSVSMSMGETLQAFMSALRDMEDRLVVKLDKMSERISTVEGHISPQASGQLDKGRK